MSLNRNLKQQRWSALKLFVTAEYLLRHRLSRKRFRHWQRQYHRANARAYSALEPIDCIEDD